MPLPAPLRARTNSAIGRLPDTPQSRLMIMVLNRPMRITGFRPMRSDSLPHGIAVRHCAKEKMAAAVPVQKPMSAGLTPSNEEIMAGKYGKTEVFAMGSANLTIAGDNISKIS